MNIINRGNITYYVKNEAIIVEIGKLQYSAYTVYSLQNRKPFYDFKASIENSSEDEYNTPSKLISLALKHNLRGVASHKPKESEIKE